MRSLGFLQYLRAFEAVARIGTLRGAADELALSPSAVSLQLRKLGEATGLMLFRKSGRNVVLTQAGREFSQTVTQSLGQLAGAVRSAGDIDLDGKARALTIFMSPSLGIAWLTATLVEFADLLPYESEYFVNSDQWMKIDPSRHPPGDTRCALDLFWN